MRPLPHIRVKPDFQKVLTLTEREYEVFCLAGQGLWMPQIAAMLGIRRGTVSTYVDFLRGVFCLSDYLKLVAFASEYLALGLTRERLRNQPAPKRGITRPPRYRFVERNVVALKVA